MLCQPVDDSPVHPPAIRVGCLAGDVAEVSAVLSDVDGDGRDAGKLFE